MGSETLLRTIITIGLIFFVLFVAMPAAGAGVFFWKFMAHIPQVDYPEPANAIEGRLQDIDYLSRFPAVDHSFSAEETARFETHLNEMSSEAETLSDAEFLMRVAAAAAITDNGHSNIGHRGLVDHLNSLPLRFFWFSDGLRIVRAHEAFAPLLGARVLAYDGQAPEALLDQLDPYFGGNLAYLRFESPLLFAAPAGMHAAGLSAHPDRVTFRLEMADGEVQTVEIQTETSATPAMRVSAHLLPVLAPQEAAQGNAWQVLDLAASDTLAYVQNPEQGLWWTELPDQGAYLRLRGIFDSGETHLETWLAEVDERFRALPAEYLLLDLRSNPGGDYMRTMSFAKDIDALISPTGRLYVLTDGGTFSAALVTTAFAVHSLGDRALIVGSGPGDFEQFWAESGGVLRLPNSGVGLGVTTGYHDWENGCSDWGRCFWLNILFGVAAGSLAPDIAAEMSYADFARGIDTPLQAVLDAEAVASAG